MPSLIPKSQLRALRLPSGGSVFFSANGMATFDRSVIKTNWRKINAGPLKHAGNLVRKIMIRSIRKVKSNEQRMADFMAGKTKRLRKARSSKPGRPPYSRSARYGHPFRKIFSVPIDDSSVIVGHVAWKRSPVTPMSLHEFGQSARVKVAKVNKKLRRRTRKRNPSPRQKAAIRKAMKAGKLDEYRPVTFTTQTVRFPKRPFALPALEKAKPRFAGMWKNSSRTLRGSVGS